MSDSAKTIPVRQREVADSLHVRLFMVDALTLPGGRWNTQGVRSPFWRFYRNADPGGYLTLGDGSRFPLDAGRVYFVPAGVLFSCANDTAFRHFYVHFDLIGLPRLTVRSLFRGPVALPADPDFEGRVATFAEHVAASVSLDLAGQCLAKSLVLEGIARCFAAVPAPLRDLPARQARTLEPVAPALAYIEDHLSDPLTVPGLAALCCLSPDHFARRFREAVGQPPGAYITERRITRAAQSLLLTDATLESIAETCGFANRHYFTRLFTRHTGLPPARYRRMEEWRR